MRTMLENTKFTTRVVLGQSRYGRMQARVEIDIPEDVDYRVLDAALHIVAAKIELAMPEDACWSRGIERDTPTFGYAYLGIGVDSPGGPERALAFLQQVMASNGDPLAALLRCGEPPVSPRPVSRSRRGRRNR
jgi:hypothetical protein